MLAFAILLACLALSAHYTHAFAPKYVLPAHRFSNTARVSGLQPYNHLIGGSKVTRQPRGPHTHTTRLHFVQTIFAAGCALSVFFYVWANIDDIKAKQQLAMDKAIGEQTVTIQNAQEQQKRTIEAAQKKQQDEIARIREMQKR
jgi:hypothetical protein